MHTTVIDLGFGDAGKGTIVDALARWNPDISAVVRFSGGAQSAHNVVTDDGRHHTFAQFGAATFVPGVRTFLGPEFLLNPGNLWREEHHLHEVGVADAMVRLSIHPDALVITPYHQLLNQLKGSAHGTTGQGIGETMSDSLRFGDDQVIRARDLLDQKLLVAKTRNVKDRKVREARSLGLSSLGSLREDKEFFEHCQWVVDCGCVRNTLRDLANDGDLIFEGSQGVLLDQDYGFHPHTTWGSTIRTNAHVLARSVGVRTPQVIGVIRTYQTRHGAGPFVTETDLGHTESHNDEDGWAGKFRTGPLDLVATKYAMRMCSVDALAITHMDEVDGFVEICDSYRYTGTMTDIDPYFHMDGDVITGIKPPFDLRSHAHMEAVTNRLWDMRPNLVTVSEEGFVGTIEMQLGKPVRILSDSPMFSGKTLPEEMVYAA